MSGINTGMTIETATFQLPDFSSFAAVTSSNGDRFSNLFTTALGFKFVTKSSLKTPTHFKRVSTLLCEIFVVFCPRL